MDCWKLECREVLRSSGATQSSAAEIDTVLSNDANCCKSERWPNKGNQENVMNITEYPKATDNAKSC